ncbi:MAG: magnesium transporter, partial [Polyangiales bacterium]
DVAEETRELGAYPEDSAGGLMTTEYVALSPGTKVWEAIEAVRRLSREEQTETVYYIYVCGYGRKLLGVLSLRDLILADPGQALADVMVTQVVRVAPTDDQEKVADTIARYDLSAIPVIDSRGRMLGVVTIDDVVDVVIEEATEDAHMMGGVVPLEGSYFSTGVIEFVWKRAFWLIVLFFGQLLTATVMEGNQRILQHTLDLVIFVPLIIASGGNAGSQSSSLIIRALAIGEMQPGDWLRVLRRETSIGLALGLLLGVIGYGRAFFAGTAVDPAAIALAVGGSIVAVVVLGTLVGSLLPVLIQRLGFDPAVSSTPFIASLVDVLGLLVYFRIAAWVLTLL